MTPGSDRRCSVGASWVTGLVGALVVAGPAHADDPPANDNASSLVECIAQIDAEPEKTDGYDCLYGTARLNGTYAPAIEAMRQRVEEHPANPWARNSLAGLLDDSGDPTASVHYRAASEGFHAHGDLAAAIYARLSFADHVAERSLQTATDELEIAAAYAQEHGDATLIALVDVERARQVARLGLDLAAALRVVREAEPVLMAQKYYQLRMTVQHVKAMLLVRIGRVAEATDVRRTMVEMSRSIGDHYLTAMTLLDIAINLTNNPELERNGVDPPALAHEALELARTAGNPFAEAVAECVLGDFRAGEPREHYQRCRDIHRRIDSPRGEVTALVGVAVLIYPTKPQEALALLDEAVALARWRGSDGLGASIVRAIVLWDLGREPAALAASLSFLDEVEASFTRQPNPMTRARVLELWSAAYHVLADRVLNIDGPHPTTDDIDVALRIIERMRTRVLVERLDAARDRLPPTGPVGDAHRVAVRRITELQRRLLEEELVDAQRTQLLATLESAEREEATLSDALLRADPQLARAHQAPPPSVTRVQAALAEDQAVLSYQLPTLLPNFSPEPWPVHASLIVITKHRAFTVEIPSRADVGPLVSLFVGLFDGRDGSEAVTSAGLYRDLLAPALEGLDPDIRRLVIVPDGPLHRLPFAALRPDPSAPPLVERFSLSTVPSLRLWLRLRDLARPANVGAVVFADPELPRLSPVAAVERAWALSLSQGLGPLPYAREEAEAVARRLGPATQLHVGEAASEATAKYALRATPAVVHFASHAIIDEANPERAAIVLAPGGPEHDGLLQTREIAELPLDGALVVLASCSSGSGTVVGGEGPIGLARAFFVGGARSVVATLWRVRDDDTQAFFSLFYRHLAAGLTVSEAVARTQQQRREAGAPAAAWAGFVVLGDGDFSPVAPAPEPVPLSWTVLAALMALMLVVAATWLVRGRATRAPA